MRFGQTKTFGAQANAAAGRFASQVDDQTGQVARRAAVAIVAAVGLLRIPTAVVGAASVPFILTTLVLGLTAEGLVQAFFVAAGVVMGVVSAAFWARRHRILRAVQEPEQLATELGILVSLSGKVDDTRTALEQIAGGGGWRVLGRLQGLWRGASMTGRWIDGIGDLPRARYFAPPKIGTTVTLALAAAWLVPVSVITSVFALIGTLAGSL